ncbi:MAG TPA: hypothetical protein VFP72_13075 [Kineosporiaceae bacterium]|nr:hypothetical protein [Kineosporiaceae bacterium]
MRLFTRTRVLLATLGLAVAAGTAAIAVPGSAQAFAFGTHNVMVLAPSGVHSILYITATQTDPNFIVCRTISGHRDGQWVSGNQGVVNDAPVRMITFSSYNCTDGFMKATGQWTSPRYDGLTNWWVNLY